MPQGQATARWGGGMRDGTGTVSLASGAMHASPYDLNTRLGDGPGTDPEELAAAAHAACFSMALTMVLQAGEMVPRSIDCDATVTLGHPNGGPEVTRSHLDVTLCVPGACETRLREACAVARDNCPMSRLMTAEVTMDVRLI
ncbi:OsmC family peroxiredoxin [Jannaschia sp.]|nr:OsmC family peroxiredoxin [Jannaschia sp.]